MRGRADGRWRAVDGAPDGPAGRPGGLARRAAVVRSFMRRCLCVVREVVGAPDYDRYLEHHARCHPGTAPLDRRGYYAEFVTRRFGPGPTRCC